MTERHNHHNNSNNAPTLVWGCIGRSCALCKKDHKACNGARPCSRCIGMGWESECRDVALKPRGRPRKTRPNTSNKADNKNNNRIVNAKKKGTKEEELSASIEDQPLSVSPSLFVSSFPFLSTPGKPTGLDISEKVNKLNQRLGSHAPAVSSGLRSDAASPKVSRKRRAAGPSSAESAANKRRETYSGVDSASEDEDCDSRNAHNFEVDKDEPDVAEGMIPFEMVFRVNLVSSCSPSSKKSDSKPQKKRAGKAKATTPTTAATAPPQSPERQILNKIEEEVDMGIFRLDLVNDICTPDAATNNNSTRNAHNSGASSPVAMDVSASDQIFLVGEEEVAMATDTNYAERYVQQYWQHTQQQPQQHPLSPFGARDVGMADTFFVDTTTTTTTTKNSSSFMFLKTEPMALAQEEKLGRNPYFIRTPPQLRRFVSTEFATTTSTTTTPTTQRNTTYHNTTDATGGNNFLFRLYDGMVDAEEEAAWL